MESVLRPRIRHLMLPAAVRRRHGASVIGARRASPSSPQRFAIFFQGMGACGVALEIHRPGSSKEITDKIISSVKCLGEN